MEKIKSFVKQNLKLILAILCGILVITGILVMIFLGADSEGWKKALFIAFGIVLIVLGCAVLSFAAALGKSEAANFFLYDNKRKSNISLDELDFSVVNRKMTFVMTKLVSSASEVWTVNVFDRENEMFAENDAFIPLVAYKMLYDLCERANDEVWQIYLSADASIIDGVESALEINKDDDLGKAFKFLHETADGNYERTEKFLSDNKKYIQNKMLKYVKANIEKF